MQKWKKITSKSKLQGKVVSVKVEDYEPTEYYNAVWDYDNDKWVFIDRNDNYCEDLNGEPTHYKIINCGENSPLTPFGEAIKLLRDLADLQNDAPLEQHRKEWEDTVQQVYNFLNNWENK
jgi:hypothetical protein